MLKRLEVVFVIILLLVAFGAHFLNMFHYPYYENDEGTYMSQAWSLITQGKMAPYTYWYDHAPAGWILIAGWVKATGGFFTFGTSVDSGRVLMLAIHLGSSLLLYLIAKKLTGTKLAGLFSVLIFSLSPLGIYFQRRVLLDNMMIFWVLASLFVLLAKGKRMMYVILSAIFFGIAILTKENAIFFIPVFVYLLYTESNNHQRLFLVAKWIAVMAFVTSFYFLYAALKGELFPVGMFGNSSYHVSLITTLHDQFVRGRSLPFWDTGSEFYTNFVGWLTRDAFTIMGGCLASLTCLILGIRNKKLRIQGLMAAALWLFLLRGKLIIDFYITPMIPLLALCIGSVIGLAVCKISGRATWLKALTATTFAIAIASVLILQTNIQYTKDETKNQVAAINWIKNNIPENTNLLIDDAIFVDLHAPRFEGDKVFPNADWSWKVEKDTDISVGKLGADWANITYIVASHEILKQIKESNFDFIKKAFDSSYLIKNWTEGSNSYIDSSKYISTNGDWMALYKIKDKDKIIIDKSWEFYKTNFIKSYGQTIDPKTNNTTSEGQSYAMLRSVWQNDKKTFDGVWSWTQDHLQFRGSDHLLSWLWLNSEGGGKLGDSEAASDADEDIALALLFAYKRWGDMKYLTDARKIIEDIWKNEIVEVDGHYYITSGPGGKRESGYLINPSYFSPASYRIFAKVDRGNDWDKLADDSYYLLNTLANQKGNNTRLPSNWVFVNEKTGTIDSPKEYISDVSADWYGFDAFRAIWRVGLDKKWFNSSDATKYLNLVKPFYVNQGDNLYAIYSLDGSPRANYNSLSTWTASVFALSGSDDKMADEIYKAKINGAFNIDKGFWGDSENYYDQNWAWFAAAWQSGYMVNLWD